MKLFVQVVFDTAIKHSKDSLFDHVFLSKGGLPPPKVMALPWTKGSWYTLATRGLHLSLPSSIRCWVCASKLQISSNWTSFADKVEAITLFGSHLEGRWMPPYRLYCTVLTGLVVLEGWGGVLPVIDTTWYNRIQQERILRAFSDLSVSGKAMGKKKDDLFSWDEADGPRLRPHWGLFCHVNSWNSDSLMSTFQDMYRYSKTVTNWIGFLKPG